MNILLIEDNSTDADLTQRGLMRAIPDIQISIAVDLKQARKILSNGITFDLAVLDMQLPDGNGLDLLMEIREKDLDLPVIVLTGSGNEEVASAALKAGADDYILKNMDCINKLPDIIDFVIKNHKRSVLTNSEFIELLYIEHHSLDIDLTKRHLNRYAPKIHMTTLPTAQEALDLLPNTPAYICKYDIILLDYRLPGLNALEFTKIIRQERKLQIPIILITGQGNEEVAIQALKLGVNEYLVKRENYLLRLPDMILHEYQHYQLMLKQIALAESESKYRLLAENSGDVIFTLDMDLNYTYVSPSVYKLRGYTPVEVMHQHIFHTLTPASNEKALLAISEKLSSLTSQLSGGVEPIIIELELLKKDQTTVWTEVMASLILDEDNKPKSILGVTRDISQKKKYEEELILAKEKAEESDRLKSAFLANMSHEIRTPMNGILGFTELLLDPDLDSEEKRNYIEMVQKSGQRMLNTVNDIVEISKIEAGMVSLNMAETNINEVMLELTQFFVSEAAAKGLTLTLEEILPEANTTIITDTLKFASILSNLIKNAIKYTDRGSITIGCSLVNKLLEFYVSDTGIGIPDNRLSAIFDRFVQADIGNRRAFQGSGLGLSIAKANVEMLGGSIWVESVVDKGSCFRFTLPCRQVSNQKIADLPNSSVVEIAERASGKLSGLKILIAEDDDVSERLLTIEMKNFGREILKAGNGKMAVEICQNNPDIDLVLMDLKMPIMNGLEATRQIRQFNKRVIIVAQTAYGLSGDRDKTIEAGCNDYISKPIHKETLLAMIEKYFA